MESYNTGGLNKPVSVSSWMDDSPPQPFGNIWVSDRLVSPVKLSWVPGLDPRVTWQVSTPPKSYNRWVVLTFSPADAAQRG